MTRRRPTKRAGALLRVAPEGEPSYRITVRQFLREQSSDAEDLRPEVRKLLAGKIETIVLGGGAAPVAYVTLASAPKPTVRERQFKHVLASELKRGRSRKVALRIAAATTNLTRRQLAERGEGPALVTEGGSRRQWFPGKAAAKRRRAKR